MNQIQCSFQQKLFRSAVTAILLSGVLLISPAAAQFASGEAIITYRIRANDTLWTLSQRLAATEERLSAENGHPSIVRVGEILYVPVPVSDNTFSYRIQPGDSLYLIAMRLGRSVESIRETNGLSSSEIHPGQVLWIPLAESAEILHRVETGDSLFRISRQYGVSPQQLKQVNQLAGDELRIGQALRVPISQPGVPSDVSVYRVNQGDTLGSISAMFGTTVSAVIATNGLVSTRLMPGQPLYIPAASNSAANVSAPEGQQIDGYGQLLEWEWARWYYPPGTQAAITDFYTGRSFEVVRLGGSNHADSEPASARDTEIMRVIFGGRWSWEPRPVFLTVRGQKFAASINSMPHDVQTIYHNNYPGHFCLYFYNSRTHRTDSLHADHQFNVLRAAGHR